jgi:hypothetical protein
MLTTTHTFRSYPQSAYAKFDCPKCGKTKRKRTFTAECTVNPFNKHPDGRVRTATEVMWQSAQRAEAERNEFMREPLCATCEGQLPFTERSDLFKRRRAALSDGQSSQQKQED